MILILDPGHGGVDPGAVGPGGTKESTMALAIATKVKDELFGYFDEITLTRTEDVTLALSERINMPHDLFVSIHCNATIDPRVGGIETIFNIDKIAKSKLLASCVQKAMCDTFPDHKNRGIKHSPSIGYPRSIYVVKNNKSPACLVECEFISNPDMEHFILDNYQTIAHAIAQGIRNYLIVPTLSGL